MKRIWNELTTYISKDQSFLLFLYMSFTVYLKKMGIGATKKCESIGNISDFKQLREIFKGISGYELKRAANDFEESIAWEMFMNEASCNHIIEALQTYLECSIRTYKDLEEVIIELEELVSELDGLKFTPKSINNLIAEMPVNEGTDSVADLFCGLSGTGLAIFKKFAKENKYVHLTGKEQRKLYCDISQLRLFCSGVERLEMIQEDILKTDEKNTYDLVIADLPKGNNGSIYIEEKEKFLGSKNRIFAEWVAIQRVLNQVNDDGKAMIIVTKGALVRQREEDIRKILTERDWLEAVITLPANMYAATHLGFELLILNKQKPELYKEKVFFADISREGQYGNGLNEISQEVIKYLKKAYENLEEHPLFSTVVSLHKIEEKEFSWNPFLYLQLQENDKEKHETVELEKIADIMRGVQISKEEELDLSGQATHYWLNIRNLRDNGIFFDNNSMISAKALDWEEKFGILEEDIILTSKGSVLKICIVEPDMPRAFLCGNLTRIRVKKEKYSPYVLYEFLNSREGRAALESIQSGTTIKVLNNTNLKKLPVPVYGNVKEKGEQLKQIYQDYRMGERAVKNRFEKQRKQLLEQLQ
ncbi:MAG: N-6 DNA methylase [Roseburia sp.]|nr:N-6 DNA methylase [Roseburia sp.]MCM1277566.1 N-6 DNA methylase [Robinsoniella sp.]